jgi:hypothetical protein
MLERNKKQQPLFGYSSCEVHVSSTKVDFNPQVMLGKSRRRSPPDTKLQFFVVLFVERRGKCRIEPYYETEQTNRANYCRRQLVI